MNAPTEPRALADLPAFQVGPQASYRNVRASLLERDVSGLAETNRALREALADVLKIAGRAARTPNDDQVVERATRLLKRGWLR